MSNQIPSNRTADNPTEINESGYDLWSTMYDQYPNPTVAIDEMTFPRHYAEIKDKNVLEVGCGTGRHTLRLLAAGNRVTGVDISDGMLTKLREKTAASKLELIKGDFLTCEIPNGPFDALIGSLVLEHIADLSSFFARAKELLVVRGQLLLSEIHPERTADGVFAHFKTSEGSEVHLQGTAHREKDIRSMAALHGFEVTKKISVLDLNSLAELNPKWAKYQGTPMIQIWSMLLKSK